MSEQFIDMADSIKRMQANNEEMHVLYKQVERDLNEALDALDRLRRAVRMRHASISGDLYEGLRDAEYTLQKHGRLQ